MVHSAVFGTFRELFADAWLVTLELQWVPRGSRLLDSIM